MEAKLTYAEECKHFAHRLKAGNTQTARRRAREVTQAKRIVCRQCIRGCICTVRKS